LCISKYKGLLHNNQDLYDQTAAVVVVLDNPFFRNLEAGCQVAPAVLCFWGLSLSPSWREV
jgi:hypothetical protein